jgi:hypothetical protein
VSSSAQFLYLNASPNDIANLTILLGIHVASMSDTGDSTTSPDEKFQRDLLAKIDAAIDAEIAQTGLFGTRLNVAPSVFESQEREERLNREKALSQLWGRLRIEQQEMHAQIEKERKQAHPINEPSDSSNDSDDDHRMKGKLRTSGWKATL